MTTPTKILTDEQIEQLSQQHLWAHAQFVGAVEVHVEGDDDFARAIEQAVLQSEQVQAWKRDAERYRWLRSPASVDILDVQHWDGEVADGEALDAYIDAAMKEQKT